MLGSDEVVQRLDILHCASSLPYTTDVAMVCVGVICVVLYQAIAPGENGRDAGLPSAEDDGGACRRPVHVGVVCTSTSSLASIVHVGKYSHVPVRLWQIRTSGSSAQPDSVPCLAPVGSHQTACAIAPDTS